MSACGGTSLCEETTASDESEGLTEGKWLGITFAACFVFMFVVWLFRTMFSRPRREQLFHKLHHCCQLKGHTEDQETAFSSRPSISSNGIPSPASSSTNSVIYYTPTKHLINEDETTARHPYFAPNGNLGTYTTETANGHVNPAFSNDGNNEGKRSSSNGPRCGRSLRKSRSTLSMLSVQLAPIKEIDLDEQPSPNQRLRVICENDASHHSIWSLNSSPNGSRSHPARLASLVSYAEEVEEEPRPTIDSEQKHNVSIEHIGAEDKNDSSSSSTVHFVLHCGDDDNNDI